MESASTEALYKKYQLQAVLGVSYEHRLPCMWSHMPEIAAALEAAADGA